MPMKWAIFFNLHYQNSINQLPMHLCISQPVSGPWANFTPSWSLCGWVKVFGWLSLRSLLRWWKLLWRKLNVRDCLCFPLEAAFKKRLYCQPQLVYLHRGAAGKCVLSLTCYNPHPALAPHLQTGLPGLPCHWWTCKEIIVLTLITAPGFWC